MSRPTLSRRKSGTPTPRQVVAYVPRSEFIARVAYAEAERQLQTPEGSALFLLLAQLDDACNLLAIAKGRRKVTLRRRVEALKIAAAQARRAAGVP